MMVIKNLSSEVDLELGRSQHSLVVGLLEGGAIELSIDAHTYGQLVGAFELLHQHCPVPECDTQRSDVEFAAAVEAARRQAESAPTVEDVRQQVEEHVGHQLASGPAPEDEVEAAAQLKQLEQRFGQGRDSAAALLASVGFFPDKEEGAGELEALALSGTEGDEPDPGEQPLFDEDEDDGVGAF